MTTVTDFYQFKYSRSFYYVDLFINRAAVINIEEALDERLSNLTITKDATCAYMRLKELFQQSRVSTHNQYVGVRMNKCYLKYIKSLNYYFLSRSDYMALRTLNEYLQMYFEKEQEKLSDFSTLNEDIKVRVLSSI
ncbi:hypothetical protein [Romboutsia sp.]|uniref:hypothetical protein n=1 Tax=Romboutsia sp. TaxID=1965302 RepID=UPI003F38EEF2